MLKNGKFIKEKPLRIGAGYIKPYVREYSEDESFMQQVYLGSKPDKLKKEINVIVWLILIYGLFGFIVAITGSE